MWLAMAQPSSMLKRQSTSATMTNAIRTAFSGFDRWGEGSTVSLLLQPVLNHKIARPN